MHDLFGLVELLVVLGLLFWFWQSQVAPLRKGKDRAGHAIPRQTQDNDQGTPPRV